MAVRDLEHAHSVQVTLDELFESFATLFSEVLTHPVTRERGCQWWVAGEFDLLKKALLPRYAECLRWPNCQGGFPRNSYPSEPCSVSAEKVHTLGVLAEFLACLGRVLSPDLDEPKRRLEEDKLDCIARHLMDAVRTLR